MKNLFRDFIYFCKPINHIQRPLDFILKTDEFIKKNFPGTLFATYSHEYSPDSITPISQSPQAKQIYQQIISSKKKISAGKNEFTPIKQLSVFPIFKNDKQICFLLAFKKIPPGRKTDLCDFLKWIQILFRLILDQSDQYYQKQKEKDINFLSHVLHDFNSAIKLLQLQINSDNMNYQYKEMIREILFYTRDPELILTTIKLNEFITSLIDNLKIKNKIKLVINLSKEIDIITVDVELINKALVAIINNAIRAISSINGSITIQTKRLSSDSPFIISDWIEIQIIDTGIGIPDDFLSSVRNPLFTTYKSEGSFGLGLTNAEKIIRAHKGTMELESRSGKGTKVKIYLPEIINL